MRMDFSLNIPTMMGMLAMVISTTVAGVRIYNDLNERQMSTNFAVTAQAQRLDKIETNMNQLKIDNTERNNQLRGEIKSDLAEIRGMLSEVIFGRRGAAAPNQQLREWRK